MSTITKTVEKIMGVDADHAAERLDELTPREVEVADLFADGLTGRQIGVKLGISPKTVDIHRGKIKMKFGVKTSVALVKYVLVLRLTEALSKVASRAARSN